jgi:hypothetical protein
MYYLLIFLFSLGCCHLAGAQVGFSKLANFSIAKSQFNPVEIAKSATPACKWPQSCSQNPGCPVYTFIGKGDWRIAGNWEFGIMPPEILPPCFQIFINPAGNENCVLPSPQYLLPGSSFIVQPGKHIIIPGNVSQKD